MESQVAPTAAAALGGSAGRSPSGTQYRISHGEARATITEGSAAVREYRVGDRDVFQSFGEHEIAPAYHGAVLVPWPNRIAAGRYAFDGEEHQLAINEPERNSALHGLACWRPWTLVDQGPDRVALSFRILPSPGYPFHLESDVEYALGPHGLRVTATSTNSGSHPLPYGIGFHPYLSAGGTLLDECVVRLDAERRIVTDDRLLPTGSESVAGTPFDFGRPRLLGEMHMDDAFAVLPRDTQGRAWILLTGPDGRTASVWSDTSCPFWQVYTGDTLQEHLRRRGLAAEPMTAAPDAFNSGDGLIVLEPGDSTTATWGAVLT